MLIVHYSVPRIVVDVSAVNSDLIRTSQIFLKICSLVRDCFHVCDLNELLVKVYGEKFPHIAELNDYFKRSTSVYDGLYYANLMQKVEFRGNLQDKDFDKKQVKEMLKKHNVMAAEDDFVEACCRLLTK